MPIPHAACLAACDPGNVGAVVVIHSPTHRILTTAIINGVYCSASAHNLSSFSSPIGHAMRRNQPVHPSRGTCRVRRRFKLVALRLCQSAMWLDNRRSPYYATECYNSNGFGCTRAYEPLALFDAGDIFDRHPLSRHTTGRHTQESQPASPSFGFMTWPTSVSSEWLGLSGENEGKGTTLVLLRLGAKCDICANSLSGVTVFLSRETWKPHFDGAISEFCMCVLYTLSCLSYVPDEIYKYKMCTN